MFSQIVMSWLETKLDLLTGFIACFCAQVVECTQRAPAMPEQRLSRCLLFLPLCANQRNLETEMA